MALGVSITLAVTTALVDRLRQVRQEHATMAVHELQAARLAERILTLHEVLSSSALLAASTGEAGWLERHRLHAAELDSTLQAAITLALEPQAVAAAQRTRAANGLLVEAQQAAFAEVVVGRLDAARALLDAPGYAEAEQAYGWGMQCFAQALRERSEAAVARVDEHIAACRNVAVSGLAGMALVWAALCLLGVGQVRRNRRLRQHLSRCRQELAEAGHSRARCLEETGISLQEPVRLVLAAAESLRDAGLEAPQLEQLDTISDSARAAVGVLDDIIDLARLEERQLRLAREPVDPVACVQAAAEAWAMPAREKGLVLRLFVGGDCPGLVLSDGERMRQVLTAVIGQSVHATEAGSISVHLSGKRLSDGQVRVRCTIRDTSCGLEDDDLARLFEPFRDLMEDEADHRPGSEALSLAISHRLLTLMGGSLVADSTPGEGTTVWLDFVCLELEPQRSDRRGPPDATATLRVHVADHAAPEALTGV